MPDPRGRLFTATGLVAAVVVLSSVGFYVLGEGAWSAKECVYFTFVTLTTVGYAEILPGFAEVPHAREFTVLVLVFGMGTVFYFVSTLTASIVEGDLRRAMWRTRMQKQIQKLEDHVIVCGVGSTGCEVIAELLAAGVPFVAIDSSEEQLERMTRRFKNDKVRFLEGDATDDTVLRDSNLASARGLVAALANDKDNLYLVVSARQANPSARIVARGSSLAMLEKLRKAGANGVVSPNYIGGLRMVSEMLRPQVVRFLDEMMRDPSSDMRIDEVKVAEGSPMGGKALRDSGIRKETDVLVLAIRLPDGTYAYNPGADFVLEPPVTLVVLGPIGQVDDLRAMARPRD